MTVVNQFIAYLAVLLFALAGSTRAFQRKGRSLRWIRLLLACTVLCELAAFGLALLRQNNMPVYHFFAPVELGLVSLYYNDVIPAFRRYRLGWFIAAGGVILAALGIWRQPLDQVNDVFLLVEGLTITVMALAAMISFINLDVNIKITGNIHFWLSLIFLVFWSGTFLVWGLFEGMLASGMEERLTLLSYALWIVNMITYAAMGTAFLTFNRNNKSMI